MADFRNGNFAQPSPMAVVASIPLLIVLFVQSSCRSELEDDRDGWAEWKKIDKKSKCKLIIMTMINLEGLQNLVTFWLQTDPFLFQTSNGL